MQSAPPEHPDTSPTAPGTQGDRDETKYTERDHDNMKPQDRFSYIDAEGRGHFLAGWISAGAVAVGIMPALIYGWYFRAHGVRGLERSVLRFSGMAPVRETLLGTVDAAGDAKR